MQQSSEFNHSFYVQPEMMKCPADMEAHLAGAGYSVKAADLELVAQRLEYLDSLLALQDAGALSISHLSAEAVHYNPSDMASWLDGMIEEIDPSSSSLSVLAGVGVGGALQSIEGNGFLPQNSMDYALQDSNGMSFSPSMGEELCMDHHSSSQSAATSVAIANCEAAPGVPFPMVLQPQVERAPSISQLIKDAIGHSGASPASVCRPKGFCMQKGDAGGLQQYKGVEDQASSNQMGGLYACSARDSSQQSPTSSGGGFSSGSDPPPKPSSMSSLQQQQLSSITQPPAHGNGPRPRTRQAYVGSALASPRRSNNRGPYQEAPTSHFPQLHQLRQNQADVGTFDAKVRARARARAKRVSSPSIPSPRPCQEHISPRDKNSSFFCLQQAPDKLPHNQALQTGANADVNDERAAQESGIKLVHLLMACAEAIHSSELAAAVDMVREIKRLASSTSGAMSKVASHFVEALAHRIYPGSSEDWACLSQTDDISELLYNNFYEACPYLKFAHFTANQAILEAFEGHKFVHVIDFNLMQGLQWPALIQALAIRPGGPPHLRMTGIGLPHPESKDVLQEIGMNLAQFAGSVNVEFSFRGMVATKLDDVKPWYFEIRQGEAIAVNSIFQLHRLLYGQAGSDPSKAPIDEVLSSIKCLKPKVVTVVEQEANHNSGVFLKRFVEALQYYSTMFDSLEACSLHPQCSELACTEMYLSREIANIVACEGPDRVERHEPLVQWQQRMLKAGFQPLHLGSNAFQQGSMLLKYFSGEGYTMEENKGCITLGWHSRPLIAASAWQCG